MKKGERFEEGESCQSDLNIVKNYQNLGEKMKMWNGKG